LSRTTRESWYQKKCSPTHTYHGHQSPLTFGFLHLLRSMAFSYSTNVPDSLFPQFLSKFSLVYSLASHPPLHAPYTYSIHFFTQLLSSFCSTCPCHHNLFCCTKIISSNPSLSQPFTWNSIWYLSTTHPFDHSHLHSLKFPLILLSHGPGLNSMQHTTSVLWRCWLGGRKGIQPVKNWVVGC